MIGGVDEIIDSYFTQTSGLTFTREVFKGTTEARSGAYTFPRNWGYVSGYDYSRALPNASPSDGIAYYSVLTTFGGDGYVVYTAPESWASTRGSSYLSPNSGTPELDNLSGTGRHTIDQFKVTDEYPNLGGRCAIVAP